MTGRPPLPATEQRRERVSADVPATLRERLDDLAARNRRTRSQELQVALERHLDREEERAA